MCTYSPQTPILPVIDGLVLKANFACFLIFFCCCYCLLLDKSSREICLEQAREHGERPASGRCGRAGITRDSVSASHSGKLLPDWQLRPLLPAGHHTGEERHRCRRGGVQRTEETKCSGPLSPAGGSGWSQCTLGQDHTEKRRQNPGRKTEFLIFGTI